MVVCSHPPSGTNRPEHPLFCMEIGAMPSSKEQITPFHVPTGLFRESQHDSL